MPGLLAACEEARTRIDRHQARRRDGVRIRVRPLYPERLAGLYERVAADPRAGWPLLEAEAPAAAAARVEYAAAARLAAELALEDGAACPAAPAVAARLRGWLLSDFPPDWHAQHDTHALWTAWMGALELARPRRGPAARRLVAAGAAPAGPAGGLPLSAWRAALARLGRAWPGLQLATAAGTGELEAWLAALAAQWALLLNHAYGPATGILDDEAWAEQTVVERDAPHPPFPAHLVRREADAEVMWTLRTMCREVGRLRAWLAPRRVRAAAPLPAAARAAFERWSSMEGAPAGVYEEVRGRADGGYFHRCRRPGARYVCWLRDVREGTLAGDTVRARSTNAVAAQREWQRDVAVLAPEEYTAFCELYGRASPEDLLRRRADPPFGPTFWKLFLWELWEYTLAMHTRILWGDVAAYEPEPDLWDDPRVAVWAGGVYVAEGGVAWLHEDLPAALEQWTRLRAERAGYVEREALLGLRDDVFERGTYHFVPPTGSRDVYAEDPRLAGLAAALPT